MPLLSEDDVVLVRQRVRALAQERRFDSFASAALTTAASELGRNVWVHAGAGRALIQVLEDDDRSGIRIEFLDNGPGIPDIQRVLVGGYSTARTLGLGLSGSKRLVDEFQIESTPGVGTKVTVTKWNSLY
jgi:serine/threonine-protein kinase RsbT